MKRGEADGQNERAGALDIRLLGPITAERDGEPASLGGPRQRAVLARLALARGQVVTVDRLVDDVWAGDPPATAVNTLQSYVSLLRRALGDAQLLRREGPGYVLAVDGDVVDASRFEDRVAEARAALHDDPGTALAPRRGGSGRVARSGARRRRRRGVGPAGRRALGRAPPGSPGDALRRPARPRPSRRGGRRAGAHDRRAPAARGVRPPPDDRPVPQRPPGRRAARVLATRAPCSPTSSASIRRPSCPSCRRRSSTTIPTSPRPCWCRGASPPWRHSRARRAEPAPQPASPVALPGPAVRAGAGEFVGRDERARPPARPVVDQPRRRQPHRPARRGGRRRQVAAGGALRRRGPRARRHRPVGPGDGRGDRPVRADGRGHAHGAADGVPGGQAPGRRRARPPAAAPPGARPARARSAVRAPRSRASSATSCSRRRRVAARRVVRRTRC